MSTGDDLPAIPRLASRATKTPRRVPRERTLSRASIAAAALGIVDAEGLDAMTMRRVAEVLGTGAASLYAHVSGKEELLEIVIDQVIGEVRLPEAGTGDPGWQEEIKAVLREIRAVFGRHRDLARASFARIPLGENALRGSEWMLARMREGGLPDQVTAFAADLLSLYVMAIAYEESLWSSEDNDPDEVARYIAEMRAYFAALPPGRFPTIVALAGPLTAETENGEDRFEFGLEVLIRGLAAMG